MKTIQILVILLVVLATASTLYSLPQLLTTTAPDFTVYWTAASSLVLGENPYIHPDLFTGIGYPPNSLLLYIPLSLMPQHIAQITFTFLSYISLVLCAWLSLKIAKARGKQALLVTVSLSLLAFPTKFTFGMGQNNFFALLFLLCSYYVHLSQKHILSGLLLGLAILAKPLFIVVLLFYIVHRQWIVVFVTSLVGSGSIIITLLLAGSTDLFSFYFTDVLPPLMEVSNREIYYNQGILAVISRFTSSDSIRRIGNMVISGAMLTSTFLLPSKRDTVMQFSLLIVTINLIDTLSWQHHFTWLLFPFVILTRYASRNTSKRMLSMLLLSYTLISMNVEQPRTIAHITPLLQSHVFIGTVILWLLHVYIIRSNSGAYSR